jgi:hypothetical protein
LLGVVLNKVDLKRLGSHDPRFVSVAVHWLVGRRQHEAQVRLASASGIPFFQNSDAASTRKSR